MGIEALLAAIEASAPARVVADSRSLTAGLSAAHVLAFALVMGGALLSNLRLIGVMFADRPVAEVLRPAGRVLGVGVVLSVLTGGCLFAARATLMAANPWFRVKLVLLVTAVAAQVWLTRPMGRHPVTPRQMAIRGACTLAIWIGLAAAACAVILLE